MWFKVGGDYQEREEMHLGVPVYKPTLLLICFSCNLHTEHGKKKLTEYVIIEGPTEVVYPRETNTGCEKKDSLLSKLQAYKK